MEVFVMKKFICSVCGYVHEGDSAPEKCPQCGAPASKFNEQKENELNWAAEHVVGVAKGADPELIEGLKMNFTGECTEVGMYLAMSRQAEREGYPEVADAFKRYAFEEAEPVSYTHLGMDFVRPRLNDTHQAIHIGRFQFAELPVCLLYTSRCV